MSCDDLRPFRRLALVHRARDGGRLLVLPTTSPAGGTYRDVDDLLAKWLKRDADEPDPNFELIGACEVEIIPLDFTPAPCAGINRATAGAEVPATSSAPAVADTRATATSGRSAALVDVAVAEPRPLPDNEFEVAWRATPPTTA